MEEKVTEKKKIGRPKGIPCKPETREKISVAIKALWAKQKEQAKVEV